MSRHLRPSLIAKSLSTRKMMLPARMVQRFAASAGVDGIDIDATSKTGAWLAAGVGRTDPAHVPVRSIWVRVEDLHSLEGCHVIDAVIEQQPDADPLVIALLPNAFTLRDLTRNVHAARFSSLPWRIAIGLPSGMLRGGRPHLVQLGGIRRFAEEWNVPLAFDLSGKFDPTWEAEAAVARLSDRLRIVRITTASPSRAAVGRDRVACRALHAAIDRNQELDIAITPAHSVPFPITPRVAAYGTRRAIDYITERECIHANALQEEINRYESPSRSCGS